MLSGYRRKPKFRQDCRVSFAVLPALTSLALAVPLLLAAPVATRADDDDRCQGYTKCPEVNYREVERYDPDAARVREEIRNQEEEALEQMRQPGLTEHQREVILGKLEIHDITLSARGNRACASCHVQETGFTGGISIFNQENVAYPGSVVHRSGNRKPMSYAYAPFAPLLHYDAAQADFVGGNFWDMRATGHKTGNPAGDQAQDPPVDPAELGLPDDGCVIYRIATGRYRELFESVFGDDAFNIAFPADTDQVCSHPYSGSAPQPHALKLDAASRARVEEDYNDFGRAAAVYEMSPEVSPFSSKFDYYLAGQVALTPQEVFGYHLFTGRANCDQCHDAAGRPPLFTNFMTANIGTPRNPDLPFLFESVPDRLGYVANPKGPQYVDNGVGDYLSGAMPGSTPPTSAEMALAPKFDGRFQIQTLRNVDKRPRPDFVKAYTHNGFFKSLESIVHFYNTRDVLPKCTYPNPEDGDGRVGVSCWPAPEQPANENHTLVGNLGLSRDEEKALVAFLKTLSDGYNPERSRSDSGGP